ncbi:hypothetical protein LJ707_06440 [Mucilaginibacter sp. UR6-1]|uniref:hypothetical protein n=1 Tax=Mucilaginibacter sp. UR6-1 TaxID=1435643 RepID=UPI001E61B85B|nr:hypothetical protein [Mucilaginibacter sp. UR6-1]MCC8408560.1 hypothetical protein [Mucilaginibacter sp. UR6-1]
MPLFLCINIKEIKEVHHEINLLSKVKNQTVNLEGAKAFTLSPEMELYTAVVTSVPSYLL